MICSKILYRSSFCEIRKDTDSAEMTGLEFDILGVISYPFNSDTFNIWLTKPKVLFYRNKCASVHSIFASQAVELWEILAKKPVVSP